MKIKSLVFRNVFLFGNFTQKIDFCNLSSNNESTMNILLGKNGSGKSSLINVLKIGMYFDKVPINVSDISNDINGNGYIGVELESFNSTWFIESNYTKSSLKSIDITKDGVSKDTGKIPETKKFIYENILDIEYHIFSNIISLSMNDFKSFIAMSAKDTRLIRDRIFGFYILNEMNEQNKLGIKKYVEKLTENTIKKDFIESEIEKLKNGLDSDEKITELEQEISDLENLNLTKTELSNNKISDIENYQKENDTAIKFIEYSLNETRKSDIKTQKLELEKVKQNIINLEKSEKQNSDEIDNIVSDIQIYYKKNSLKQYNSYVELLSKLTVIHNEQIRKVEQTREEYNKLVIYQLYDKFNAIIDKTIEDLDNIKEIRGSYITEFNIKTELSNQYTELIKLRDEEQKSIDLKIESIKNNKEFIELYKSGVCPTCQTSFENDDYHHKIVELEEINENIELELPILKDSLKIKNDAISTISTNIDNSKRKMIELKLKLKSNFNPVSEIIFDTNLSNVIDTDTIEILTTQYKLFDTYLNTEDIVKFGDCGDIISNLKIKKPEHENIDSKKSVLDAEDKELQETISKQKLYQEEIGKFDKTKSTEINQLKYASIEISEDNIENTEEKLKKLKEKSVSKLIISESERKLTIEKEIETLENNIVKDESQYDQCKNAFDSIGDATIKIEELQQKISLLTNENQEIVDEISNNIQTISNNKLIITNNKDLMKTKMVEYNKQIDEILKEYSTTNTLLTFLKIIEHTLSDKGIKSYVIGKIIPYINQSVNHILNQFDLPLAIKFDDEFKPAIYRFGNEVSYKTISLGQSKMIDYSIICTIIKFIKNRCPNLNVVFLDEIFSSLHVSMLPIILEITKREIVENLNMDVFLVNHSLISPTFFDNKLEMTVENNFSNVKISSIKKDEKNEEDGEL